MRDGRTFWWGKDAGWWRRERIVELGLEFGADGPAVIDWLSCEAKAQEDGGWVKAGHRSVAHGCFVDVAVVSHVLSRSVTLGLLDDFEDLNGRFVCRISGWKQDQDKARAAKRKAEQRARESESTGNPASSVTLSHAPSRPVTECPPTEQNRIEQKNNSTSTVEPRLDGAVRTQQAKSLFAYWQERCEHPTAKPTRGRLKRAEARLAEGYSLDQIRKAIDGAARAAFVNEQGKRFDDFELICRSGEKLESFIDRADLPAGSVTPMSRRSRVIADQNDWQNYYPSEGRTA